MLRLALAALSVFLLTLSGSLRAETVPQGQFMLGTYIWTDKLLPRYATLRIDGAALTLTFSAEYPLNYEECDKTGNCLYDVTAATATVTLENGRFTLSDVAIDQTAKIDPKADTIFGSPASALYTKPLIAMLLEAKFSREPFGFRLDTGTLKLAFYQGDSTAFTAARTIPLIFEQSIAKMARCEIRAILPLFQNPSPTAKEQRFLNALNGAVLQMSLERERRSLDPLFGTPSPEDKALAQEKSMVLSLPNLVAGIYPDPAPDERELFWEKPGKAMFRNNRAAFDAALAYYGDTFDDLVAFTRYLRAERPDITVASVCTDPSLGFGP